MCNHPRRHLPTDEIDVYFELSENLASNLCNVRDIKDDESLSLFDKVRQCKSRTALHIMQDGWSDAKKRMARRAYFDPVTSWITEDEHAERFRAYRRNRKKKGGNNNNNNKGKAGKSKKAATSIIQPQQPVVIATTSSELVVSSRVVESLPRPLPPQQQTPSAASVVEDVVVDTAVVVASPIDGVDDTTVTVVESANVVLPPVVDVANETAVFFVKSSGVVYEYALCGDMSVGELKEKIAVNMSIQVESIQLSIESIGMVSTSSIDKDDATLEQYSIYPLTTLRLQCVDDVVGLNGGARTSSRQSSSGGRGSGRGSGRGRGRGRGGRVAAGRAGRGGGKKRTHTRVSRSAPSLDMDDDDDDADDEGDGSSSHRGSYKSKSVVYNEIIKKAAERGVQARASNNGRLPDKWVPDEMQRLLDSFNEGLDIPITKLPFTGEDIRNKIRSLEAKSKPKSKKIKKTSSRTTSSSRTSSSSTTTSYAERLASARSAISATISSSSNTTTAVAAARQQQANSSSRTPFEQQQQQQQQQQRQQQANSSSRTASIVEQVSEQVKQSRCSYPFCSAPPFMPVLECSEGTCTEPAHLTCYHMHSVINGDMQAAQVVQPKCFECFHRGLAQPFNGPCSFAFNSSFSCQMPSAPTQLCEECNAGLVHRLCVPSNTSLEGRLLCSVCYTEQTNTANALLDLSGQSSSATLGTTSTALATSGNSSASSTSAATAGESSSTATASSTTLSTATKPRNKGGRPKGSTDEKKRNDKLNRKRAVNYVCNEYAVAKEIAQAENRNVEAGYRASLVEEAREKFSIVGEFDVPRQTISDRIKANRLTLWGTGAPSPMLEMEVALNGIIVGAWQFNYPLTVGETMEVANNLIEGTQLAADLIVWKQQRGLYNPDQPLLGPGWFRGYKERNRDLVDSKVGRKFARLRAHHCTWDAISKMFNTFERGLVECGSARYRDTPVLMNQSGEIVEDEADAYGYRVTIEHIRPDNVLVADETGSSTREMGDGNNGGQRCMAPIGEIPRVEASSKHAHFTVVPFTRMSGELVMVAIIFAGKKMKPEWAMGIDIFAPWVGADDEFESNIGDGKYFPMGPSCVVDDKTVPCYCDCSPKGSMTANIMKRILSKLDDLGVMKRGTDDDGKEFYPALVVDGHISRMGLSLLKYMNDDDHRWMGMLVCPYGTSKTQVHDDEKENAAFKCKLTDVKRQRVLQRRKVGLPADLGPEEIPIIVKLASDASYAKVDFARRTFSEMGYNPFTRAVLDDPEILSSAPDDVQAERGKIIALRRQRQGIGALSRTTRLPPNQVDLTTVGSGLLAGGAAARDDIMATTAGLNTQGTTAHSILTLLNNSKVSADARRDGNNARANQANDKDQIIERYQKAKQFTAGVVFFQGQGMLDSAVYDEVLRRYENKISKASEISLKKKKRLLELQRQVELIKRKMKKKKFKLSTLKVAELKAMCKWKKHPGDTPLPTRKADLLSRFKKTKNNQSPHVSPCSSDVEDDSNANDDDDVDSLDSDASDPNVSSDLEFSEDESEEEEECDSEEEESEEEDSESEEEGDEGDSDASSAT